MKTIITKLPHPEYAGDWHDRPLRWKVSTGHEVQKFAINKNARLYKCIRSKAATEAEAIRTFAATI